VGSFKAAKRLHPRFGGELLPQNRLRLGGKRGKIAGQREDVPQLAAKLPHFADDLSLGRFRLEHRFQHPQVCRRAGSDLPCKPRLTQETNMTRFALILAPMLLATAATAQATLPEVPDADGNGTWSLVELQAVWTDMTEDAFNGIDTNADGAIDVTELQAALDNGVLTAPEASN
jgi:hypothetical protein